MVDEPKEFWFNMKTGLVEEGKQTAAIYRVGPFQTRNEAERALETIANRSKSWLSEDERDE